MANGRPPKIKTPEELYQLFKEYKAWAKSNPFRITDWVGGAAKEVTREKERPLTMEGFNNYVFELGIVHGLENYFANSRGRYKKFSSICRVIREQIRQDQIEGGLCGMYNPSITQRLNNLVDKVEQTVIEQPLFKLDGDEIDEDE